MGTFFVYNESYAGKCYWTEKRGLVTGVFSYDQDYLSVKNNWNIDPALSLTSGAQAARRGLPSSFSDAAPDRWGQNLIRHRYLREAGGSSGGRRALNEVDYLLGVSDLTRQGDLRFSYEKDGDFLHPSSEIPRLIALPKLLDAAFRYTSKTDESAIAYLLDAGSASLGGARPKAAVSDGKDLFIAKFPHKQDEWDVIAWEWISLCIAAEAGISVPENRLVSIDGQNVLLTKRFDRVGEKRIGYISAMTMLQLKDGEQADYLEIAEKLRDLSTSPKEDLHELFLRIVLSVMLNNTDDHLRNHGLIRAGSGWRLSPVFDINPNPDTRAVRATSIFAETENTAALAALRANADAFDLTDEMAETLLVRVASAIKSCTKYAKQASISSNEQRTLLRIVNQ